MDLPDQKLQLWECCAVKEELQGNCGKVAVLQHHKILEGLVNGLNNELLRITLNLTSVFHFINYVSLNLHKKQSTISLNFKLQVSLQYST